METGKMISKKAQCGNPKASPAGALQADHVAEFSGSKEKRLFVRVAEREAYRWFWLNLDDNNAREGEEKKEIKFPVDFGTMPLTYKPIRVGRSVGLGNSIYVVDPNFNWRGSYSPNCEGFVWDNVAAMIFPPRIRQAIVAVAGKIYVFGGLGMTDRDPSAPFAEVYDPKFNVWKALPEPPQGGRGYVTLHAVAADADLNLNGSGCSKRWVLLSICVPRKDCFSLFGFCVDDHSWICIDSNFGEMWYGPAVVAGHLLLCPEPGNWGNICAYNLRDCEWLPHPIWRLPKLRWRMRDYERLETPCLLMDLGNGKLCYVLRKLICCRDEDDEASGGTSEYKLAVYCNKFCIRGDTVVMESTQEFLFPEFCYPDDPPLDKYKIQHRWIEEVVL